jgi:membrane protein implicated in regulation of membrane protease activity
VLYRTLGFTDRRIIDLLYRESRVVPLLAICTGVAASLLSVSFGFAHVGVWLWVTAGTFVLLFIGAALYFVRRSVQRTVRPKEVNRRKTRKRIITQ